MMLGFLAEFLVWVIVWSIEHFFTNPTRLAEKKLRRLVERNRRFEDSKE
ncbi:hypothetical protein [Bradyrhizobium japonicum]|jgi:hypothetical protein|uniref:Uncharacterized protein n=1 Tax=Bradyrhizobium japonicum TaxID=375 RepID=A0ABV2S2S4_BRAJP|nr:hypothetical protein [Bradyrhizobium japonicum]BAL11959.1 hypothetical protein BJ6T_67100 [Bradyrhizobium japonicum USDA 6]MBR0727183.1 hypothetical protein [Bradyrhizobium japonicum]MBR0761284.1 hypothetical protein [Bradyrhizobium japonicum]MBR0805391.1 hypothetical protein [Bradyrhizobium japonicum]MCD9105582.1 hypothetical protein [Bradyrhizobium japonicum]